MRKSAIIILCFIFLINVLPVSGQDKMQNYKDEATEWIDNNKEKIDEAAYDIWEYAELAFGEYRSAERLSDLVEQQGFSLERGVADIPMAFIATYGSGSPVIGILGEYDALPGLSQKAGVTYQDAIDQGGPGQGCGHNLLGVGSAAAAIAVKQVMEKYGLPGTIKFFGCPAEEAGGGKIYMVRDGFFDGLDVCFDWHPSQKNLVSLQTSTAMNNFHITFKGKTAHAAGDPWNGRSALDAVELMNIGVNFLREHLKPTVRIHYVIPNAGQAPNVVPDYASVWYFVRDRDRTGVEYAFDRVLKIAEGAALMTGTEYELYIEDGLYNYMVNKELAVVIQKNLEFVGAPPFTPEDHEYAREIQRNLGKDEDSMHVEIPELFEPDSYMGGGSTDAADVSWKVPTARFSTACWPMNSPGHSWVVVSSAGYSVGFTGMRTAAKTIASSVIETLLDPSIIERAQAEFTEKTEDFIYKSPLPAGQKPKIIDKKK